MKNLTNEQYSNALSKTLDFLDAYVDYHIDEKSLVEGELTDSQTLSTYLPILHDLLKGLNTVEQNNSAEYTYSDVKYAAESVNPNYKYCVVDSSINYCYLTDDLEAAMSKAKALSYSHNMVYALRIQLIKDGTYMTFFEAKYINGEPLEVHYGEPNFLHFNYIAKAVGSLTKL